MAPRPPRRRRAHATARLDLAAIEIVGALLTPDMVARIAAFDASDQTEAGYGVPPGLKIRDEIARYFRIGEALWSRFEAGRATSVAASEHFVLDLLRQCFGFDTITEQLPIRMGERVFPVRHAALGGRVPIVIAPGAAEGARRSGVDESLVQFADGTRRRSATLLLQEYLNASDAALWGLASDGLTLRLMRDNISLTRPAWIEADLAKIFTDGLFPDFTALWLLIHQSRFGAPNAAIADCPLERWRERSRTDGVAAREKLRLGVEAALEALGQGFIEHPDNTALRQALSAGDVSPQAYFEQLLRLVYRLIFLFAAEDRELLHPESATTAARRIYAEGYGVGRLRERCMRRIAWDQHTDGFEGLKATFRALSRGESKLGLPPLGGLFAHDLTPQLTASRITNRRLLAAIWRLAWLRPEGQPLTRVNWRDMETEELGSVYEGLLELTPRASADARSFTFAEGGETRSHARKTTGSYYTPEALVKLLLDSALDPVLDAAEARNPADPATEILKLSIIDPACGSGHFLLAAARRAAARIAKQRSPGAPSQVEFQRALREVVSRCIYGVDRNPLAVELCKVALWIEALEPGKPLTFLEARIRCGDSLIGVFDYAMLEDGIPDEAYKPLTGDDKKAANAWAKLNRGQRDGKAKDGLLSEIRPPAGLVDAARAIAAMPEDTLEQIAAKEKALARLHAGHWLHLKAACDLYVAAFRAPKTEPPPSSPVGLASAAMPLTDHVWRAANGHQVHPPLTARADELAHSVHAFHWPLEFPDILARDGFDVVLGNPPWIRQELLGPIKPLLILFKSFNTAADSSVYFVERGIQICRRDGRVSMLTPNKWFKASYGTKLRTFVRQHCRVELVVDFGHSRTLFPDADTFPAALSLAPVASPVCDRATVRFVRAHDSDRESCPLAELISSNAIVLPHRNLRDSRWDFEATSVTALLDRLTTTGNPLESILRAPLLRGLLTGLNEAFYVDSRSRDALVASDPGSEHLFKKLLRGRDIGRWTASWHDQWHIVIKSSQNHAWPWSYAPTEAEAEMMFENTYPSVYNHLRDFKERLVARRDKGAYWWELRSCGYYEELEKPKIMVQCIAYYSRFALDTKGHYVNNKVIIVPTDDHYILGVLNSRVIWWIVNRTFQHMKDEGLSVDVQFLKALPIPDVSDELRASIAGLARQLVAAKNAQGEEREIALAEVQLNALVEKAFALTDEERQVLVASLPPRDPLVSLRTSAAEKAK